MKTKQIIATHSVVNVPLRVSADGFGFPTPSGNIYYNDWVRDGGAISCTIIEKGGSAPSSQLACRNKGVDRVFPCLKKFRNYF